MNPTARSILGCVMSLSVLAAAIAAWHFWQIDGVIACIMGICGLATIGAALEYE